jgi:hypothetical protein
MALFAHICGSRFAAGKDLTGTGAHGQTRQVCQLVRVVRQEEVWTTINKESGQIHDEKNSCLWVVLLAIALIFMVGPIDSHADPLTITSQTGIRAERVYAESVRER